MENENKLTEKIIGASFAVSNQLGVGFLEKVYENAMVLELRKIGLNVEQQKAMKVYYDNQVVGQYFADLLVENKVVIELKVVEHIGLHHQAQLMNYLKASRLRFGLLINFKNTKVEVKRMLNGF